MKYIFNTPTKCGGLRLPKDTFAFACDQAVLLFLFFRYDEIKDKLTPYLKKCGFNPKTDIFYMPVSGLTGFNLKEINNEVCPWYK